MPDAKTNHDEGSAMGLPFHLRDERLPGARTALACVLLMAAALSSGVRAQSAAGTPAAEAASPGAQPQAGQIDRWIEQLGDDSFSVRKAAAESLLNAGPAARERLQSIAVGPDPELRSAARRIVSLIETTDFRRRLDAFAADVDGKAGLSLPGWELYRDEVGDDAKARALFIEMQRHEAPLLAAMFGERSAARDAAWEERLVQLVQSQLNGTGQNALPPLASCATMLLVGSEPKREISDRVAMMQVTLVSRPPILETMQNGTHRDALRRLVAAWIVHCPNNSEMSLRSRVGFIGQYDLAEALPLAISVATAEPDYRQASPITRMAALLVIGQVGKREHVDRLERLLDDQTVCFSAAIVNQSTGAAGSVDVQIRDVALVVLLRLTEQNASLYGYRGVQARFEQSLNPLQLAPPTVAQRDVAIAKWRKWREAQRDAKAEQDKGLKEKTDPATRPDSEASGKQ